MLATHHLRRMPVRARLIVSGAAVIAVLTALLPVSATTASAAPARVRKVLIVVEENHSLAQMKAGMPYTFAQAKRYGYAGDWSATTHPSLPNYLAMVSGRTQGVTDDDPPSSHPLRGRTIFGQAVAHGKTARTYAEGMTSPCRLTSTGRYAVKHNPWAYFTRERAACRKLDRSTARLGPDIAAGSLPNLGLVVPDLCNDAHDCSLATADNWFKALMRKVKAGPDWKSGRLAVVLTADEDDRKSGNKVLTVVMHPSLSGKIVSKALTHYSLTRFVDDVIGAKRLHAAATAPDLATAFGLRVGRRAASSPKSSAAPSVPQPPASSGDGVQAAVQHSWGPVVAGDEFGYTGSPSSTKWSMYDSAGQSGNGLRRPSAWHVDGSVATVTGDTNGTTGGMSAKFDHRKYGRWEVRMRTNVRDPQYHPVAILWPDGSGGSCPEIDYAEATSDTSKVQFFLHYGCSSQRYAAKSVDMTHWHNFAVEWTPSGITGYLDGAVWFRDNDTSHLPPGPMHQTLQLDWFGGSAKVSTMSIDWVRVYNLH
jgi:hypothetical protein